MGTNHAGYKYTFEDYKCPRCSKILKFIEMCSDDDEETKLSYTCDECKLLIYLVFFKKEGG